MIRIETVRLVVREHKLDDLEGLHALLSNAENTYFIQDLRTNTLDETRQNLFVAMNESQLDHRTKVFLAIEEKSSGEYVGEIGYTIIARAEAGAVAEMGYFILEEFWGKGYVTEAAKALLDYAFNTGGLIKIEASCNKTNYASEKVMIKLGMTKEAEFLMHSVIEGQLYDRVCYRMLKSEW